MKAKQAKNDQGNFLYKDLIDQLNPKHPLLQLAGRIPWERFEREFSPLYSGHGRPAKPIRRMVGLMILKQLEDLSDERVVEAWVQNPYFQAFCGEKHFQWKFPCDSTDFVYFRKRIGEDGARLIFEVSVDLHGEDAKEREITVDTTVQEKNITFPTDVKLLTKVIKNAGKSLQMKASGFAVVFAVNCQACCANGSKAEKPSNEYGPWPACSSASWSASCPRKRLPATLNP